MIVKSVEFDEPIEITYLHKPSPISKEDLVPAKYLFEPRPSEEFEAVIMREVKRRWAVIEKRKIEREQSSKRSPRSRVRVDENGVLVMKPTDKTVPVGPRLKLVDDCFPEAGKAPFSYIDTPVLAALRPSVKPSPPQYVPKKRGRARKPPTFEPLLPIHQYQNRFFYMRSSSHPYSESYSFQDVGKMSSALWNDYRNSYASDYFTYLTVTTYIHETAMNAQMAYSQLWDYSGAKPWGPDNRAVITDVVTQQKEWLDEKFKGVRKKYVTGDIDVAQIEGELGSDEELFNEIDEELMRDDSFD